MFGPTVSEFRAQLRWLKQRTRILSEDELLDFVTTERRLPCATSVVTFDDGYRDNYDLALPILHENRVPAIFFIPTESIAERRLGWWDVIAYFLKRTSRRTVKSFDEDVVVEGRRTQAISYFQEMMKRRPAAETSSLLYRLSEACGVGFPSREEQDSQLMTWDQIRDAASAGMTVGSHTHTHRVCTTLGEKETEQELRVSRRLLQDALGRDVVSIAYPCGVRSNFSRDDQRLAARSGYRLAFSFNTGVSGPLLQDPFDIPRVSPGMTVSRLAAIATFPRTFGWRSA